MTGASFTFNEVSLSAPTKDGHTVEGALTIVQEKTAPITGEEAVTLVTESFRKAVGQRDLKDFDIERQLKNAVSDLAHFPAEKVVIELETATLAINMMDNHLSPQIARLRFKDGVLTEGRSDPLRVSIDRATATLTPEQVRALAPPAPPAPGGGGFH